MRPPETSPYQLLVEGVDDRNSVIHLLKRHGFDWDNETIVRPFVNAAQGITELLQRVPVAVKGSYQRLGFVVDADIEPSDRRAQITGSLGGVGLQLPVTPAKEGIVIPGLRPGTRIGFWLMPDNTNPGVLEDFLSKLVPAEDTCWEYAHEVVHEARRRGSKCKAGDHIKRVWLF